MLTQRRPVEKGYTLIETAIVLTVLGMLLAAFASAYSLYYKNKAQSQTVTSVSRVVDALNHFLIQNGRYPCPARMDVGRDHDDYGLEGDCKDESVTLGDCANGICIEEGQRDINTNPNPDTPVMELNPRVRRGAVPFRTLGIPEETSEDGYRTRLYYVVTEKLADADHYRKDSGAISVVNRDGNSLVSPEHSAHFVVFSVGQDRRGGVTRYGVQYQPCLAATAARDARNCSTSTTQSAAEYVAMEHSPSNGAEHYDDYLRYYASVETPLWRTASNKIDIIDLAEIGGGNLVGVSVSAPAGGARLHVAGAVRVAPEAVDNTNALMTDNLCPEASSGANCFKPDAIGGDNDNPATQQLQCNNPAHPNYDPTRPFITGFANGVAICGRADESIPCEDGGIARGFDANGKAICKVVTGCVGIEVNMCQIDGVWQKAFIPSGVLDKVHTTDAYGASFRRTFRCTNGNWTQTSTSGSCNCTAVTNQPVNVSCASILGGPVDGWTGTATRPLTRTCPSGAETYGAPDTSGCTCVPREQIVNRTCQQSPFSYPTGYSCPAGQSPKQKRDWVCNTAQSGSYTAYSALAGSDCCACTAGVRSTRWVSCGPGYTGQQEQERFTTCSGSGYSDWTNTANNNCVCNEGLLETGTQACPEGQVGVIQRRREWNCSATPPNWGAWVVTNNDCGPPSYQWRPKTQAEGPYGTSLPNTAGSNCSPPGQTAPCSFPSSGGYNHYSQCVCE